MSLLTTGLGSEGKATLSWRYLTRELNDGNDPIHIETFPNRTVHTKILKLSMTHNLILNVAMPVIFPVFVTGTLIQ